MDCPHPGYLGLVTILVSMIHTPMQFYIARFLLGLAEAGFSRIIVYLTHWFRHEDRARRARCS